MPEAYKILSQRKPPVGVRDDMYIVPSGASAVISTFSACNVSGVADTFSVSFAPAGSAHDDSQLFYSSLPLEAHDTFVATIGATLQAGDIMRVNSSGGHVAFSAFGTEVT